MKKQKVYDSSLINSVRQRQSLYDNYIQPKGNVVEEYTHEIQNPVSLDKPEDFGITDLAVNAFYDWNQTLNSINKDESLGRYIRADEDYNTLLGLKEYINATRGILEVSKQLSQNPDNEELKQKLRELSTISLNSKPAYEKALKGEFNHQPLNDQLPYQLKNGRFDAVLSEIDYQTNISLKPNQKELEDDNTENIQNTRITSLKRAEKYADKARYYDSKINSEYYRMKKTQPGMDFTDIDTYLYKLPGLFGSSANSLGKQILGTISAVVASISKFKNPLVGGLAALGSIAANIAARDSESNAEVYSNYKTAIQNAAEKSGISKIVLKDARNQMKDSGKYTKEQIQDDDYIYDQILSGNIKVNNNTFDKIRLDNLEGIRSLFTDNMALSTVDVAQQALEVVPLGSIAKSVKGLKALQKLSQSKVGNALDKAIEAGSNIRSQLANRIDDITQFGIDNIDKLPTKRLRKNIADLGGRIAISSVLEGAEEGIQYIKGQRYIDRDFDPDPNIVKSWVKNLGTGARAIFAAITPWDPVYSNDQEFIENFKGGALLGGLTTGAISGITNIPGTRAQIKSDQFLSSLYAESMNMKDRVRKNILYSKKIREGKWDNLMESFDYLSSMNIDGIDKSDIEAEKQRAQLVRNTFTSQTSIGQALAIGIDPRTEEYDTFVALKDHHDQLLSDASKRLYDANSAVEEIMYSPEVEKHIVTIAPDADIDTQTSIRRAIETYPILKLHDELINDFFDNSAKKLEELEKNTNIRTSRSDVIKFKHALNKDKKAISKVMRDLKKILDDNNITEQQLEVPEVHQTLKDALQVQLIANLDRNRAELEREIMFSTDEKAIKAKIDKYNKVDVKDNEFIQKLDDLYSGKKEEQEVEDAVIVGAEPAETVDAPSKTSQTEQSSATSSAESFPKHNKYGIIINFNTDDDTDGTSVNIDATEAKRVSFVLYKSIETSKDFEEFLLKLQNRGWKAKAYDIETLRQLYPFVKNGTMTKEQFESYFAFGKKEEQEVEVPIDQKLLNESMNDFISEGEYLIHQKVNERSKLRAEELARITKEAQEEYQAQLALEEIKAKERKQALSEQKDTPIENSDVTPITPVVDPDKTESAQVQEVPTLGSILGNLLGDEAVQQMDQPSIPVTEEHMPEQVESKLTQLEPLTYDPLIDPYSHQLAYEFKSSYKGEDGLWRKKSTRFRGMEDYLNDEDFGKVSTGRDFIQKAQKEGVHFEVKEITDSNTGEVQYDIYAVFNIDGKKYAAVVKTEGWLRNRGGSDSRFLTMSKEQQDHIISNLNALRNKIIEYHKLVKNDSNYQIVPTGLKTTTGKFVNLKNSDGSPFNRSLIDTVWQTEKDPYKITPDNTEIGVTTGGHGGNVIRLGNRVLSAKGFPMGKPAWVIRVPRADGKFDEKVAILNYKNFKNDKEIAELILDLVTSNQLQYKDKNGVQTPMRPLDIVNFIVNFGSHTATDPNDPKLNPDQIRARIAKQFYLDDNNNLVLGPNTYSISDLLSVPDIHNKAIQYIMDNFHYTIDEDGLTKNYLGGDLQSKVRDTRFESVRSFLKNSSVDNIVVLPGKIEFSLKDFGLKKDKKGNKVVDRSNPNGISVLGWYIKQGVLTTDIADYMNNANIYVDDVQLVDKRSQKLQDDIKEVIKETTQEESQILTLPDASGKDIQIDLGKMFSLLDGKEHTGPNMTVDTIVDDEIAYNDKVNVEQAKAWLDSTLGISPEIRPSVIDVTEAGLSVVGRVKEDSILIYEQAPKGVEYHEAWHRVSQLLIDEKRRNRIYDRYHKKGIGDKQIDEILAEQFREFMLYESGRYAFDTKNWFRRILDFIKLWARTGQYALARLYSDINRGKFYGIQPSEQNVRRFRNIYGETGVNMEVNGYTFKTLTKVKQFDDIVKSLIYAFFQTNFTDGKTIDYADLVNNPPKFDTLKLIVQAQAYKFPSPVMTEIVEKFDDVFAPSIASRLKNLGIRTIDKNENDTITDIEEGSEGVNIGQHTVEGMNISIKDNAPAEVKFFFQTIPQYIIGKDGKTQTKFDELTHFPSFVDSNTAWNKILKDLAGCRTITNIMTKVVNLQKYDPFYQALLVQLNQLINDSDKGSVQAEAKLTKIETVITSDINNYITAKIEQDRETGMVSMSLTDNTVDVKSANYPKVWSQSLFTNSGLFKYNSEGVVVAEEGAVKGLSTIINNFNKLKSAFQDNRGILKLGDRNIDLHIPANQEYLKDFIVRMFNVIGILIDKPTINRMLMSGDYGNPKADQYTLLSTFVTTPVNFGGIPRIVSTLNDIKNAISKDETLSEIKSNELTLNPTQIWNNIGFVKELANYYAYVHATENSLNSYGPDGNTYYMVSQNNFAKDRINELNTDQELFADLDSVVYNQHSIILDAIRNGNHDLQVETLINFKDNTTYDAGRDYFGITDREDYIAKMTAVFNNRLIFPTVADKKTYHMIKGITLPHERIKFQQTDAGMYITYGDDSLDILLGYCQDELNQIELTLRQIDDDPSHYDEKTGIHYNDDGSVNDDWLDPSRRIKNFHTPNKYDYKDKDGIEHTVTLEGNGARFLFLTGIYTDKGFVSFNDPTKSAKENLETAKQYFFNTSIETQKAFLSGVISKRVKQEIETAKELGLITSATEDNKIWSLRNELLDDIELGKRKAYYANMDPVNAEGYAIFDMLADYTINSIISVSEIEKIFSGAPAYYKIKYDKYGITDISVDKIKRLGSLTSTGINNRLDFFNDPIRQEYTVAELKDHEIQSKQYYDYERLFTIGNIKETIQELEGEDAWNNVKNLSIAEIEKVYPDAVDMARKAAKVEVAGYKKGINVADAAVYISPNMTRDLLRMRGVWSEDIKKAFDILTNTDTADKWESDPQLYAKANKVVLNAMKYVAFGTRFNEIPGLGIPYFNKMALFPLFKSIATGDIKALYDRMVDPNNPLDMVMFDSAVKAGSRNPIKAYRSAKDSEIELRDGQTVLSAHLTDKLISGEGNILNDFYNLTTYTQKFKYLRQQLETNPHTHEEQMAGTQFMKVNLSNLRMGDMYGKEGDQVSGQVIKDTVMNALNQLSDIGKAKLQEELFKDGKVNITHLGKMLERDARESGANDNVLSGLATKDDAFVIPLSALSDNKWLESRFISMINKLIIDVHMPGGAFIQRSAFGIEATSTNVITEDMINDGKPLLSINNKDGSMDSVVSINLFKHIIPDYKKMTFRQARKWLIDKGIIGQNAEATAIGYRIPTQSVASISALRFVDVFPEIMGDTIMLPEDFTKLTGSDFDIDKLYVARFGFDDKGIRINDDSEAGIKNRMLDAYMKVLLTKDNTSALKLSIDNATENVKDVLKDIESSRPIHYAQPMEVYTPSYQEARKAEYTGGKAGIGPFALNNAHHILTQLTKLRLGSTDFTNALKLTDLGRIFDYPTTGQAKGGRILDWLSAMINGFVDIAKDPYIVRLNVNSWTYNMVSFLLRTGKGKQTFYFMSQPILKEMAQEVLKTKGKYGVDRTKTPSQLEKEAIERVLDKYDPDKKIRKQYEYINRKEELKAAEYQDLFTTYLNDKGEETSRTRENLFASPTITVNGQTYKNSDYMKEQVRIYYAWKALKPYADDLANLVKYSKIDTKKTGKTFAEQQTYYNGMWDLAENSKFADGEVRRFYRETFIARKTENSIPFGTRIFANLLFRNTDQFIYQKDLVLSLLGRKATATSDLLSAVINSMEAQLKSEFFNQYARDNNIDTSTMFKGKNSMAKRLNRFKQEILKGNAKLSHLLNRDGTIANDFVNYLIPNINNDALDFIDTSSLLSPDQATADNLINYWRELIDDSNPQVSKLFKDLVVYAFATSGDNSTMNSFFQYVPNSYRKEMGYVDFVKGKLEQLVNNSSLGYRSKDEIFLNNWNNDKLVRPVDLYHPTTGSILRSIFTNENSIVPNIILGQRTDSDNAAIRPISWIKIRDYNQKIRSYPLFPPYIKIKDNLGFGPANWHVYTLIGYKSELELSKTGKPTGRINYYPLYGLVSKRGYKYRGHTIVEYGKNTELDFNREQEWDYSEALQNSESLVDMAHELDKDQWRRDLDRINPINELLSYQKYNYALSEQDRVYEESIDDFDDSDNVPPLEEAENAEEFTEMPSYKTYKETDEMFNNTSSTNNDPVNFASSQESFRTIQSDKTILSNAELIKLRPYAGNNPRIAVASEHTDPVFFSKKIIEILDGRQSVQDKFRNTSYTGNDFAALYLITKHDGLPLKNLLEYKIPKLIHFSITGLGGTKWEPGVMKYNDLLDRIQEFIKQGLDPEMVTVRIDPIVPGVTLISDVENIVRRASEMGIKNIRFSVMDQYSTTKKFMEELGYDYSKFYDSKSLHARPEILQSIENKMLELKNKYGVSMSTCAEPFNVEGISKEACLSVAAINNMLGTSIPETATGKQRQLCSCYGGKTDLLRYDNKCASSCIYCYAHHNNNKNLNYYNEDGTLKDNPFTRTTVKPQATQLDLFDKAPLSGIDLVGLYKEGDRRVKEILEQLDNTPEENQTYLNEFAAMLRKDNVTTQEGLEEAIRKFICNL